MGTEEAQQKTSKQVYFAILPEKYEPLVEDEGNQRTPEEKLRRKEKRKRRKKKYIRVRVRSTFHVVINYVLNLFS